MAQSDEPTPLAPPEPDAADRLPIEAAYRQQWEQRVAATQQRFAQSQIAQAQPVRVDLSPESLALTADLARQLPPQVVHERLRQQLAEPSLRAAVNSALSTVSGGVLSLDAIDEHLRAEIEGRDSPLAAKLQSPEVLKLLDPAGNTMDAVVREQMQREGMPQELIDKTAATASLLAGLLTPVSFGRKGAKAGTTVLMNTMFSAPSTHAANIASNALTSTWAIPERFLSAAASAAEYGLTLGRHERQVFFGESGAMLIGALNSIVDAIREAGTALRTGESRLPSIMQDIAVQAAERPLYRYGPEGLRPVDRALADDSVLQQGYNFWNQVANASKAALPTRALGAEDAFFKTINRQMEIWAQTYREAARTGDTSLANLQKLLENPDPTALLRADSFATAHTFQRSIDELGPAFSKLGGAAQWAQDINWGAIPVGRLAIPVLRTPVNLAHFTLERSPLLNALSSTWKADVAAGGALRSQAIGKFAGGATLSAATLYMANAGLITGGGPSDATLRRNMLEIEGWRPYSLKIGDTYYAYNKLAPLGALIGIAADAAEIGGSLQPDRMETLGKAMAFGASRYLTSNTFLQQTADFFSALSGDETAIRRLLAQHVISELTPGMVRTIRKEIDPVAREAKPGADLEPNVWSEVRVLVNQLRQETPGWSTTLPPRRNIWGAPVALPSGWGPDMISPVYTSTQTTDPASLEVTRLEKAGLLRIGRVARTIFGRDPDSQPFDMPKSVMDTGVELTDREYDDRVRLAGNDTKDPATGLGFHDTVNDWIANNKNFQSASDALRASMITNLVNGFRRAADGELLTLHPGLLDAYEQRMKAKADALAAERQKSVEQQIQERVQQVLPR